MCIPIEISIIPGRKIISIPISPINNAKILYKRIYSIKKITAKIVTIKGTIKDKAEIFSKGTIVRAANPKSMAGKFKPDLIK